MSARRLTRNGAGWIRSHVLGPGSLGRRIGDVLSLVSVEAHRLTPWLGRIAAVRGWIRPQRRPRRASESGLAAYRSRRRCRYRSGSNRRGRGRGRARAGFFRAGDPVSPAWCLNRLCGLRWQPRSQPCPSSRALSCGSCSLRKRTARSVGPQSRRPSLAPLP